MSLTHLPQFVAETSLDHVPAEVLDHAKLVLLDDLGAILAGSLEPEVAALATRLGRVAGGSAVLGCGFPRVAAPDAALINGTAGTFLEQDEGHRFARGHPGIHVIPAALAFAEETGASGRDLLAAIVLGYEVAARIGMAATLRPVLHTHGTTGTVGAAAACARLRKLDADGVLRAMHLGASLTLATTWRAALDGATVRNCYAGVSNSTGILVLRLLESGFTPLADGIQETFRKISGTAFDEDALVDGLGVRYEITRNYFKLHACCRLNHGPLDSAADLIAAHRIAADEVGRVTAFVNRVAATMEARHPENQLAAKFSLPYALACLFVRGSTRRDLFAPAAVADPAVQAFADRVEVREDPAYTAASPNRPNRVEIELRNGRRLVGVSESARGEFDNPYPRADLEAKFLDLAGAALGPDAARRAMEKVARLETFPTAPAFTEALAK